MSVAVTDFAVDRTAIDGLVVGRSKQVTDDRGTVRELFRRSAFAAAGIDLARFEQINVTESVEGVIRGMHAEAMTKLVSVAAGEAHGAYVDLRPGAATFGVVVIVELRPGVWVVVPPGVGNGFQATSATCQYVYCFDAEWQPGMQGTACTPFDPELGIAWPIPVPDDDPRVSAKDRAAPTLARLRAASAAPSADPREEPS